MSISSRVSEKHAHQAPVLTAEQMERYSRQILLPEIGVAGQAKLLQSRVAIVGAGGLGSPTALYLAAAGIGTIGLIDADRVDRSNLHRQILHVEQSVGELKTTSGRRQIERMNPDVTVVEHQVRLDASNALEIFAQYDVIINGSDNFPTRYLVNDACVLLDKPLVDASILKWEGQLNVFLPGEGCYRCLYPQPPKPGMIPSCAEAGIIGAVGGIMGSLQVMETIKILLGLEDIQCDRTFYINIRTGATRTIRRKRRPNCPVCSEKATIHELIDYELFCGLPSKSMPQPEAVPSHQWDLSLSDAIEMLEDARVHWIDMRSHEDYEAGHVPGAVHVPFHQLIDQLDTMPQDHPTVLICNWGTRSKAVVHMLQEKGHTAVYHLQGGMLSWENQGLQIEKE